MPELPEVEVTARVLAGRFAGHQLATARIHERRLRWPVPPGLERQLAGARLAAIERRGKYLLFRFDHGTLIAHLGMSGSWRIHEPGALPPRRTHDHADLDFDNGVARYTDPRRFGALLWHAQGDGPLLGHPLLAGLGVEPLGPAFEGRLLHQRTRGRRASIKQVLLAGAVVVGVGNIYASESLFYAGIDPRLPAGSLGRARCERLAQAIQWVLQRAIEAGGSTLRDFAGADGHEGAYSRHARVYERAGLPCPRCGATIRRLVQGARATYHCPRCQRR